MAIRNYNFRGADVELYEYVNTQDFRDSASEKGLDAIEGKFAKYTFPNDSGSLFAIYAFHNSPIHIRSSEEFIEEASKLVISLFPKDSLEVGK